MTFDLERCKASFFYVLLESGSKVLGCDLQFAPHAEGVKPAL